MSAPLFTPSADTPSLVRQRTASWIVRAALFAVLGWLAWVRFARPPWPAADPDTWGYLHPAISKLLGGPFAHTYGRNFVYPGWVYLLLRTTGDFRAITAAQHILGLATCLLLWTLWRQWRGWFRITHLPRWADPLLGLGLVVFFGRADSVVEFESQIRPEAVFPFVAVFSLCLQLGFLRAWYEERRAMRASAYAAASLFTAVLAYEVKPSFGFAVGFTLLPAAFVLVETLRQRSWRSAAPLAGMLLCGGLASVFLLILPERELARSDGSNAVFLPETLLTIHAGPIAKQLNEDVRDGAITPFTKPWLITTALFFDQELEKARQPSQKPFPTLGYNPDYLMYAPDSFCHWLYEQLPAAQISRFCFYYYYRAWLHQPGAMLFKVVRQLGQFYSFHCPAFRSATNTVVGVSYQKTLVFVREPSYRAQLVRYLPARAYVDAVERLGGSNRSFRTPPLLIAADVVASGVYLPLLLLFLAAFGGLSSRRLRHQRAFWVPGIVLGLIYAVCFGNCLTIAVVHALSAHRYTLNLLVYAAPCEAATLAWLWELFLDLRRTGTIFPGRGGPLACRIDAGSNRTLPEVRG